MLTVRLSAKMEKNLTKLAKKTGRTKSYYVKKALQENLDDMADVVLSDQVREAVENGEAVYTHDEVMAKLGFS
jgi:RHH-type rel operon transcriptional repressor/antitoxin RelB